MRLSLMLFFALTLAGLAIGSELQPSGELAERYATIFTQLDIDNDGQLTEEEAAAAGLTGDSFRRLDTDGNGLLSLREFLILATEAEAMAPSDRYSNRG